jgi:hypothetical protein
MVTITLRVLSRPDVAHLSKIYQSLGMDYDERVLPSIGNEVLKSIVAQFDAAELITQREVVRAFVFMWIAIHSWALGIIPYKSGSIAACRGIQHQVGRCVNHTSYVRTGTSMLAWKPLVVLMVAFIQEFTQAVEAKQIAQQGRFTVHDLEVL